MKEALISRTRDKEKEIKILTNDEDFELEETNE